MTLRGRDLLTGLPRSVEVGADQIREAIEPSVQQIVDTIKDTIEETPPELVADIMDQGIVLAGGGALLAGPRPSASRRRPRCPSTSPTTRSPASSAAPAWCSKISSRWTASSWPTRTPDRRSRAEHARAGAATMARDRLRLQPHVSGVSGRPSASCSASAWS